MVAATAVVAVVPALPAAAATTVDVALVDAVAALPEAPEDRTGYTRDQFRHWIDADGDGCNTRQEALIAEAVEPPTVDAKCVLTGGLWYSYYDNRYLTPSGTLDVDHMVPLAEAWDSGASQWTADQRRAYANDLDDARLLVSVSAASNRSKADKDPAQWLPPEEGARCRYITDWVAMKTRWGLSVDTVEKATLVDWAGRCPGAQVVVTLAS